MRRRHGTLLLLLALFAAGLIIFLYPTISNRWNQQRADALKTRYYEATRKTHPDDLVKVRAETEAYNQRLIGSVLPDAFAERDQITDPEYERLLNVSGDLVMGVVEIPSIHVSLPVSHYTTPEVLESGAGHLHGSSLPVGGTGTHAVISAHRGLPSAVLFTNLNLLEEGDRFYLQVLDQTLVYEVDQIKVVEPTDTSDLSIIEGEDLATLMTCTPYAVNTQRLLVRGYRVNEAGVEDLVQETLHTSLHRQSVWPIVLCAIIGIVMAGAIVGVVLLVERRKR